jgi:uncharacterized membrane protein
MQSRRAERYAVTPLPFLPFSNTGGEALNHNGIVAGGIANADGSVSLARWCKGVLTDLGVPPRTPDRSFDRPRVFGMNSSGTIVGTVHTAAGDLPSRSFIHDGGRFTVLPLLNRSHLGGAAIGINGRGQVVGYDRSATQGLVGWLWDGGTYSRVPIRGTNTAALGINSGGAIVGNRSLSFTRRLLTAQLGCRGERGYVLINGTIHHLPGFVYAINDLGEAAGGSAANGKTVATVFRSGIATIVTSRPSYAVGINSFAEVVGRYQPAGYDRQHLFKWREDCGACDLTPEGFRSAEAAAINDRGEILGFGETLSGRSQYFLLTPDPDGVLAPEALLT